MTERQLVEAIDRDPREVARARHLVSDVLRTWDVGADVPVVELLVSELVSNAMAHGQGAIQLCLDADRTRLRLEVHDDGGGSSAPRVVDGRELGGWGLRFVDELADCWGSDIDADGTSVWAVTPVHF